MAVAWLAHLRIRSYGFWPALGISWAIVLPEMVGFALLAVAMVLVLRRS